MVNVTKNSNQFRFVSATSLKKASSRAFPAKLVPAEEKQKVKCNKPQRADLGSEGHCNSDYKEILRNCHWHRTGK